MKPEPYDPETGEVLGQTVEARKLETQAADGRPMPRKAVTIADTLRLLNDGQFDADASGELRDLIQAMEAHGFLNKGVSKGQITITLDISLANGAHVVVPSVKVKKPQIKVPGTLLFAHEDGGLSRNPPGQGAFFGVREVTDQSQPVRSV